MPVAAEVVQHPMASPFLDTISASVPFDYASPLDKPVDVSSSIHREDSLLRTTSSKTLFFLNSKDDETISSVSSHDFNNITEDEKIQAKNISPEQSPKDMVRLQLITQNSSLLPGIRTLEEPVRHDEFEHHPFYSPQIQVKLYRPKSLASLHQMTLTPSFGEIDGKGIVTKSVSSSDVRHSSLKAAKNKLRKKFNFHSARSSPSLNEIGEGIELQSQSCDDITISEDKSPRTPKRDGHKGLFLWNRMKTSKGSPVARKTKNRVVFSTGNIHEASSDVHNNGKPGTSFGKSSSAVTDNRKLENGTYASAGISNDDSTEMCQRDNEPTTIKIARRSSLRGGQYCTLVRNFSTVLPPDEIAEKPLIIKDATDVFPLNSGEVIVTDILSNKMVMFNVHGLPKITYAMEPGSEPWSTFVTSDGIMAVTLKGAGCVSLWSPTGESLTEFGEDTLTSPTGIIYDHKEGRFIVADEHNNIILSFSKTGQFLGEFVNQQSPNSAAGNRSSDTTSHVELTFNQPRYICASRDGLRFVSDSANQVVKMFDEEGVLLQEIGSYGKEDGQFRFPYGVAFDDDTKLLYVADHYNNRISVFSLSGSFLYNILSLADGITRPKGLAIHRSKLYVTFGNLRAGNISVYRIHANQDCHAN